MPRLGVNIDHVATLRQARGGRDPDPVWAAAVAELGGADGITIHLREDRRHIQDRDLRLLRETVSTRLNLEISLDPSIIAIAADAKPDQATLVPEHRAELTTEGGLDLTRHRDRASEAIRRCRDAGIEISLFLDPDPIQVAIAAELGADAVELHTGRYADARGAAQSRELEALTLAGVNVRESGMTLHAGHGLNYSNVFPVAAIPGMAELNIGHSIVSRAVFTGLEAAVRAMKEAIERGRSSRRKSSSAQA